MVSSQKNYRLSKVALSLVIPLYNESKGVRLLANALQKVAPKLPHNSELILVNDGSVDDTSMAIKKASWPYTITVVEFSRNFGHQAALLAGLRVARGEKVVTLDGDLQHPPSLIPQLYALSEKGYDVVLTQRIDVLTKVSLLKKLSSSLFYLLMNVVADTQLQPNASDFRLLNRKALNQLLALPEHRKFLRGMVSWIGFKSVIVPFEVGRRVAGSSKYSLRKMLTLAFHGVTSFSVVPLYFSGIFSVSLFLLAFFYAMYVLYVRFVTNAAVSGWASVLFVLLILGGFITLFLGVIGFYLAAIFEEVKQRPAYVVRNQYQRTRGRK